MITDAPKMKEFDLKISDKFIADDLIMGRYKLVFEVFEISKYVFGGKYIGHNDHIFYRYFPKTDYCIGKIKKTDKEKRLTLW